MLWLQGGASGEEHDKDAAGGPEECVDGWKQPARQ